MSKKLTIDAAVENLNQVIAFTDEVLEELAAPMKTVIQMEVCIEELFVNIASYAYSDTHGTATIIAEPLPDGISFTFIDTGIPYNPLERPDPDITLSAEERRIGGYGIYIVKKSVDAIEYRYENGQNILTIRKKI